MLKRKIRGQSRTNLMSRNRVQNLALMVPEREGLNAQEGGLQR